MFIKQLNEDPRFFWAVIVTVIVSICLHELAHGLIAILHGDRTPIEQHRLTPNPLVHMGLISMICLLISGIAWGAMPIDRTRLRGRYAEALVALAGPVMNVLIALIALTSLATWQRFGSHSGFYTTESALNLRYLMLIFGMVNFNLAMFNLIPVPPLDGSHILANLNHSFDRAMRAITMSGGSVVLFIIAFSFAGKFTGPAAASAAAKYLHMLRGY